MKTERNSFEPIMSILKIVYMCGVLLYFMFLTGSALGQAVNRGIGLKPGLATNSSESQRNKVRRIYTSQIGVREKQPNSGPQVDRYLRYVNLPKGNPWCAAFVCWSLGEAEIENPRSGWSPELFRDGHVIWSSKEEQGTKSKEQGLPQDVPCDVHGKPINGFWTASRRCACPPLAGGRGWMECFQTHTSNHWRHLRPLLPRKTPHRPRRIH